MKTEQKACKLENTRTADEGAEIVKKENGMKNQNTEKESRKTKSTYKRRRMSLAVQVNLLIVAITLGISLLQVAISAVDYRRAILDPFTDRLAEYEVKEEDFAPFRRIRKMVSIGRYRTFNERDRSM